jgi:NDP-sugar pyrophosphorylase family protein
MQKQRLYNAVIISGGVGSRLNLKKPKILAKLGDITFLDFIYKYLRNNNFKKIVLFGGYGSQKIISHIKKKKYEIDFIHEKTPLGTGGAIIQNLESLDKNFLVILGDIYTNLDLKNYFKQHCKSQVAATILSHSNDHVYDSNLIIKNKKNYLLKVLPKGRKKNISENLVFSGIYFFSKYFVSKLRFNTNALDLESDLIEKLRKKEFKIVIRKFFNFLIDFGTTERIAILRKVIKEKINFEKNLTIFDLEEVSIQNLKVLSSRLKKLKLKSINFLFFSKSFDLSEEKNIIRKIDSFFAKKKVMVNEFFFLRQKKVLKKISKNFKYLNTIKI